MSETTILADPQDKNGKTVEPDYQDVLRVEFNKLHREYRSLENKRHGIAQREGYIQKRTNHLLPFLEKDHAQLQHEMTNATCRAHLRNADLLSANMKEALKTFDLYQQEIAKKIKQINEIERHVDRITDKVIKQRFKMLALHGLSRTTAQRQRDLTRAEDKLYHFTCSFNLQINENKRLREEIMDFLMERGQFFKMHNSIKRQIGHAKKKMLAIVQQAISTYDNRDEAMTKVKALREREAKEIKVHGMEVQEFERTLHHDKSILDFIKMKLKNRPAFEDATERRVRMGSAKERELDGILKKYGRSFKKILSYSNTNSILDLVDKYNVLDAENFETFKYITDLNNECEVLREGVEDLKSKIETVHTEVETRERDQRVAQQKLQLGIIGQEEQMEFMRKQLLRNKTKHSDIYATIAAAMVVADCDTSPIMRLLGNADGLNENNIRLCFSQLDIKITEMRIERDRLRDIKSNLTNVNTLRPVLAKSKPPPSAGGPFVPKLIVFHGESVDEEDVKIFEQEPYYYNEMKEYVMEKAIEDKVVDPSHHKFSTTEFIQKEKSTQSIATTPSTESRKTLVQKIRDSEAEGSRRRRKHTHKLQSEMSVKEDDSEMESIHKSESIIKFGHEVEQSFLKRKTEVAHDEGLSEMGLAEEDDGEENEELHLSQSQVDASPSVQEEYEE